jgi:hypothetical protein
MKNAISKTKTIRNYLIIYFVIAFSGIPFFDTPSKVPRLVFLIIIGFVFFVEKRKFSLSLGRIVIVTLLLLIVQTIVFAAGSVFTFGTFISFVILAPYFALKIVGPAFIKIYRDILYILAIISLAFWGLTCFYPGFFEFTLYVAQFLKPYTSWPYAESLIFYTIEWTEIYGLQRNPGPFHEPGAYSVFLILGIFSEFVVSGKILSKRNIVFIISILTTMSTAGYLALFLIVGAYTLFSDRINIIKKLLLFIVFLTLVLPVYNDIEFLNKKIEQNFEQQASVSLETPTTGRFLGIRKSFVVLGRHHIYGRGLLDATQPDASSIEAAGYGWIYWISRIGIILGPLYMFFMFRSMEDYSRANGLGRRQALILFFAILIVLGAQKHTSTMLFFMLFLVSIEFPIIRHFNLYKLKP